MRKSRLQGQIARSLVSGGVSNSLIAIDNGKFLCHIVKAVSKIDLSTPVRARGVLQSRGKNDMSETESLVHSRSLPPELAGELLHLPRQKAMWEWMSFFVRRLLPGETYQTTTEGEEAAFVLLGGVCTADWGKGAKRIGKRKNVFDGFPYALYLPSGNKVSFTAESACEIAECRVPSKAQLEPKLITPRGCIQ